MAAGDACCSTGPAGFAGPLIDLVVFTAVEGLRMREGVFAVLLGSLLCLRLKGGGRACFVKEENEAGSLGALVAEGTLIADDGLLGPGGRSRGSLG